MDPQHNVPFLGIADPVAAVTHCAGLVGTLGCSVPLWRRTQGLRRVTVAVFALTSALLFMASTAYHAVAVEPLREVLRHLDHACIYLLIAGTFTPIVANLVRDPLRLRLLATVWALAALGVVNKLFWFDATPEWLDVTLFLGMGWFGLVPFAAIVRTTSLASALWMPLAGALYSAGALSEFLGWPVVIPGVFGFHEVFHLAVIGGGACFYVYVARHVVPAPSLVVAG